MKRHLQLFVIALVTIFASASCSSDPEPAALPDFGPIVSGTFDGIRLYDGLFFDTLRMDVTLNGEQMTFAQKNDNNTQALTFSGTMLQEAQDGIIFTIPQQTAGGVSVEGIPLDQESDTQESGFFQVQTNLLIFEARIDGVSYRYVLDKIE